MATSKCESNPEADFVWTNLNYKLYANIGQNVQKKIRFVVVLDTGAGSNFIRLYELSEAMINIKRPNDVPNVKKVTGKALSVVGTIEIVVKIYTRTHIVNFLNMGRLATSLILGADSLASVWRP